MTFYSSSVKNKLIDPVYDNATNRTEWRFDVDTLYSSKMKILNVGYDRQGGAARFQHKSLGVYGTIKKMMLMDGNVVLDQLDNFTEYMSFKNVNNSNDEGRSIENEVSRSSMGYRLQG